MPDVKIRKGDGAQGTLRQLPLTAVSYKKVMPQPALARVFKAVRLLASTRHAKSWMVRFFPSR